MQKTFSIITLSTITVLLSFSTSLSAQETIDTSREQKLQEYIRNKENAVRELEEIKNTVVQAKQRKEELASAGLGQKRLRREEVMIKREEMKEQEKLWLESKKAEKKAETLAGEEKEREQEEARVLLQQKQLLEMKESIKRSELKERIERRRLSSPTSKIKITESKRKKLQEIIKYSSGIIKHSSGEQRKAEKIERRQYLKELNQLIMEYGYSQAFLYAPVSVSYITLEGELLNGIIVGIGLYARGFSSVEMPIYLHYKYFNNPLIRPYAGLATGVGTGDISLNAGIDFAINKFIEPRLHFRYSLNGSNDYDIMLGVYFKYELSYLIIGLMESL